MSSNVVKALLATCIVLGLILLAEWWLLSSAEDDLQAMLKEKDGTTTEALVLPELKQSKKTAESYIDMVERPLFIQGRRPVVEEMEEVETKEVAKVDNIVLFGVYSVKDEKTALFNIKGSGDRTYSKKIEGDDVSGWSLAEILNDRVVLEQSGNKQTLMLRKPKPKHSKPGKPKRQNRDKRKAKKASAQRKPRAIPAPDPEVQMPEEL